MRSCRVSPLISTSKTRWLTSNRIISPSRTAAIGPPSAASGETCPAINPWVAPLKRPSVKRATDDPKPSPNRTGDAQHFAHPRSALGAFVADDDNIAGFNFLAGVFAGHCGHGVFFRFEDPRRTAMLQPLMPADFRDTAFGREIALQDDKPTGFLQRLFQGRNHLLPGSFE